VSEINGKEFKFEEASYEEFLAHFATVEERVAYLEELERKMEFKRKKDLNKSKSIWRILPN
jgi:hypothetical protein